MRTILPAAILAPLVLFTACSGSPTESDEYKRLEEKLGVTERSLESAKAEAAEIEGDLPAREQKLANDMAEYETAAQDLITQAGKLEKLGKELRRREKAVGIAEDEQAARTVPGEGVYRVGPDVEPGTYRSVDNGSCYWSVNADANGEDIITNGIGGGSQLTTLSEGQFFETSGCNDWVRQD